MSILDALSHVTGPEVKEEAKPAIKKEVKVEPTKNPVVETNKQTAASVDTTPTYNPTTPIEQTEEKGIHKNLQKFKREEFPLDMYYEKPFPVRFQMLNAELHQFLQTFSSQNQRHRGKAILNYNLMEVMMEVIIYDLGLKPYNEETGKGFQSIQEIRDYLQRKINPDR